MTGTIYQIENKDLRVQFTDLGASIVALHVKDRGAEVRDVVLGYGDVGRYAGNSTFMGAIVGPFAGEISPSDFIWEQDELALDTDEQGVHLHGGQAAFSFKRWTAKAERERICFSLRSPAGEGGYPGTVECRVLYRLEENRLCVEMEADSDECTPINLTAHPYFNLNGHAAGDVSDHFLRIRASSFSETSGEGLLYGKRNLCEEDPAHDFREIRTIGPSDYDCNYYLESGPGANAELYCEESGIRLSIYCTQPCMQLYTANETQVGDGKDGASYGPHSAVCLEPQYQPNGVNIKGSTVPCAGGQRPFRERIVYEFALQQ